MSEEHNNAGQPPAGEPSAETKNTEHMIPKSRFDEVIERARKAEEALARLQSDHEAKERERLQQQGEWQQIAENERKRAADLSAKAQRAEALEKAISDANKARIDRVPESMRPMVPVDYPPDRLQVWLDANWERLVTKPAPDLDAGAGSGSGGAAVTVTEADRAAAAMAMSQGYKITPENVAKARQERAAKNGQ